MASDRFPVLGAPFDRRMRGVEYRCIGSRSVKAFLGFPQWAALRRGMGRIAQSTPTAQGVPCRWVGPDFLLYRPGKDCLHK